MPKQDSDHNAELGLEIPTASSQSKSADEKPRSWKRLVIGGIFLFFIAGIAINSLTMGLCKWVCGDIGVASYTSGFCGIGSACNCNPGNKKTSLQKANT